MLGGVTWISSSGVIAKALGDLGRLGNRETPAVLHPLTDDLAMVAYLPLLGALLGGGGAAAALGSLALAALTAAVTLIVALRYGERIARLVEHSSQEVVLLSALALVLVVAGIAERLQISAAVGAFLLGIALSGEVAERTRELLTPLRDLAAALFFLFFGLSLDTGALAGVVLPAAALALLTALTKVVRALSTASRRPTTTTSPAGMATTTTVASTTRSAASTSSKSSSTDLSAHAASNAGAFVGACPKDGLATRVASARSDRKSVV